MQKRKLAVYLMAGAMLATSMPITAYAEPAAGTQEIESSSLVDDKTSAAVPVEYTVGANFNVKLPSAIELTKGDNGYAYSGTVGVKGDIDSGKVVKVTPAESVTMYDVTNRPTEDVPANAGDQAYDHKDAKDATVAQAKKQWAMTELSADTYSDTDLMLTAGAMQSGKWKGLLNVNIEYGADETQQAKAAGLYAAGGAFTPWNDLVSAGTVTMDGNMLKRCKSSVSGEMVIPDSVTSIGDQAFNGCSGLTSIAIPNSVTSIGNIAFGGCSGLTSIAIPNSVTSIGNNAFSGCTGLTSITIPNSVTSIGNNAFNGCSGLTSITIPDSVTSIGNRAFYGCSGLTSVTILDGVTSIGNNAFDGCSGLTSITIPDSVTSIGDQAFNGCSGLTSIAIPNSVTSIGSRAFEGCTGLESITVAEGNTKYDSRNNCNAIIEKETNTLIVGYKNTVIPDSVTSIGDGAFYGCSGLTSIAIPNSVTSIGNIAFGGCTGLTSITIPNSVTSIGNYAFNYSNLADITFTGTQEQWNAITKESNWNYAGNITTIHCTDGDITI